MEEVRTSTKSKDRFGRRKPSKSPMNIRGKIKELEVQMEKHHKQKESPKAVLPPGRKISPKKNNLTVQNLHSNRDNHPHRQISSPNEFKKRASPPAKTGQGLFSQQQQL